MMAVPAFDVYFLKNEGERCENNDKKEIMNEQRGKSLKKEKTV